MNCQEWWLVDIKLLYEIHEENGTLEATDLDGNSKLNVLDLEFF